MQTDYGLEFIKVGSINETWGNYDRAVANCHLSSYGFIIVDASTGQPIDNEYDLIEIESILGV